MIIITRHRATAANSVAATSLHEIVKNAVDASMNEFILKFDHAAYYRARCLIFIF